MTQEFREAMLKLYEELREVPDSEYVIQIMDLAFQMDDKGEFWKFKEIFGDGEQYRFSTTD